MQVDQASTSVHENTFQRRPCAALQLISLSLDKWGSKAVSSPVGQPPNAVPSSDSVLKFRSLEKWGSKAFHSPSGQPPDAAPSSDGVLKLQSLSNDAAKLTSLQKTESYLKRNSSRILLTGLSLWVLVAICLLMSPLGAGYVSLGSPRGPPVERSYVPQSLAPQTGDGSFACRYRQSYGQEREALSLLLRCNIISKDEFASNCVSQEHIDECVWIATQMLQQRQLEDWVSLSQHGRQSFEDTVAAIYEARENARANASATTQPVMRSPGEPINTAAYMQTGSSVSLGSSVSFGHDDQEKRLDVPSASRPRAPLAKGEVSKGQKSPVPVLNCYEQADVAGVEQMSLSSQDGDLSSKGGEEEEEEGGFPSVFSSSSGFQQSARSTPVATPAESYKSPDDSPSRRLRLPAQEIMTLAPVDAPRSPQSSLASPAPSHSLPLAYTAARRASA